MSNILTLVKNKFRWQDSSGEWHNVDVLRGEKGDKGATGEKGADGSNGATMNVLSSSVNATSYTASQNTTVRTLNSTLTQGMTYFISAHAVITNTSGSSGIAELAVRFSDDDELNSSTVTMSKSASYTVTRTVTDSSDSSETGSQSSEIDWSKVSGSTVTTTYANKYGLEVTGFYTCQSTGEKPYMYIYSGCSGSIEMSRFQIIEFDF